MVGWTDTGLIWWDSTTVLPVLRGTIGQDGQGFFRAVVAVLHGGIDTIGYSKWARIDTGLTSTVVHTCDSPAALD